ncbi:hypothetical protein D8674_017818 [Pyrus ussuriensis x Pyrus communis]|uniref:Uncharacterized protein n=1 Tax=Pyrus ussuriensis x Pyrus communis TaxID=2448454 RepID=A0A5N5HEU6_9ROSA|nr:hypothetical protein D8674_017818 [Pyrus ussuriensis x Pyrus communis]
MTCVEREKVFKECENEDDLVDNMDMFNSYSWSAKSFEHLQDNLFFTASRRGRGRVDGDVEIDEEKEEEEGVGIQIIPPPDKPLYYCKMTDPSAILRILQWSTTKKQSIHEQLQMYITESRDCVRNVILMSCVKWQAVGIGEIVSTESEKNTCYWT